MEKWDNFYEGNNIHFYYSDGKSPNSQQLKSKYSLDKLTSKGKDDLDKALEITSWLNNKLKFSKNSIKTEEDTLTILEKYKRERLFQIKNLMRFLQRLFLLLEYIQE